MARKITGSILLILFLGYFGSITLFSHTHHIDNGEIIVHSHPFKSFPGKEPVRHSHSTNGFIQIHSIEHYNTTFSFSGIASFEPLSFLEFILLIKQKQDLPCSASLLVNSLRGPPDKNT
jgi:hypothetical protein